jgi:hypothetical protein
MTHMVPSMRAREIGSTLMSCNRSYCSDRDSDSQLLE